ncbi:hypothetical protein SpCBS45565_g07515 [Spizellomyces sp. 'palustris']|nr:hypothetical protein SpCBS45565_g07515 [Spizellomyces sp. 'palustris']
MTFTRPPILVLTAVLCALLPLLTSCMPVEQIILDGDHVYKTDSVTRAPLITALNGEIIEGRYIVILKRTEGVLQRHLQTIGAMLPQFAEVSPIELPGLQGYVGNFPDNVIDALRSVDEVAFIEKDQVVHATATRGVGAVQHDAPWGLGRICHKEHPTGNESHTYVYYPDDGKGVTAYVVDTGINIEHVDFEGRAKWGATIPFNDEDIDGNGHGTHVAGTIAGAAYGVAKQAEVVAVKVLRSNGSGTMSDVVRGIEWVVKNHRNRTKEAHDGGSKKKVKSIGNMSLGGGMSRVLNMAVNAAYDAGVLFAVAAGNDNQDACDYSPASAEKPITVGATTKEDIRAWFSNWGKCTDIFAPGHQILSAWIGSNEATNTLSGTSMATPHVAGILAAFLSRPEFENLEPKDLKRLAIKAATQGLIIGIPEHTHTKNRLAFSLPPSEGDI